MTITTIALTGGMVNNNFNDVNLSHASSSAAARGNMCTPGVAESVGMQFADARRIRTVTIGFKM